MADQGNATAAQRDGLEHSDPGEVRVRRALLSVSDKTGVVEFARGLSELGIEIVSTGGTSRELSGAGLEVRSIEDFTGFPEIMDGRVKTLHPRLYAGLLAVRDDEEHLRAAEELDIEPVDLVCVNLYPFERTVARGDATDAEVIEQIDIGGPTMIRAAAKNHAFSAVVVDPTSYDAVLEELSTSDGRLSLDTRTHLASLAFACTARYDAAISTWFSARGDVEDFPPTQALAYEKVADLRYGENPHQRAAYYAQVGVPSHLLGDVVQHHGKELSFNNLLDLDAARALVDDFNDPACSIIKHSNPCGCALGDTIHQAYERAFACDPLSAYGGVIAVNRPVDRELAEMLSQQFVEVLLAPGFSPEALEVLTAKANVRLLERRGDGPSRSEGAALEAKPVLGGILLQDRDAVTETREDMTVATTRAPSEDEWADLLFAWRVCRHVRSNAIVLAKGRATVGIGAGQMSRVDSVRIAVEKGQAAQPELLAGCALASDAFFPFADGPQVAAAAGVTAMIQPGGSVRDEDVIAAANRAEIAMVTTGRRHFRH